MSGRKSDRSGLEHGDGASLGNPTDRAPKVSQSGTKIDNNDKWLDDDKTPIWWAPRSIEKRRRREFSVLPPSIPHIPSHVSPSELA
tara:strand:- start:8708 stop:8965 length:258 start_codon:yes stop_codon:yes gene_type:complete